jgi:hypothetical protein
MWDRKYTEQPEYLREEQRKERPEAIFYEVSALGLTAYVV